MFDSLFFEKRLVFLKGPNEGDGVLDEHIEQVSATETTKLKDDVDFLAENYMSPLIEMTVAAAAKDWGKAWEIFYKTFLEDGEARQKAKRYFNLVGREYNLVYRVEKLFGKLPGPAGWSHRIVTRFYDGAFESANWALDKLGNGKLEGAFAGATAEWESLDPEKKAAFIEKVDDLVTKYDILDIEANINGATENVFNDLRSH